MQNGWLIAGGILIAVLVVNIGLAISALRGRHRSNENVLDRSLRVIRNPWADEDKALSELHQLVSDLEESDAGQQPPGSG
jgi:hypothetical protein